MAWNRRPSPSSPGGGGETEILRQRVKELEARLLRDGSGCGCHFSFKDEKDLDGTQDKWCAYHHDQRKEERAKALEEAAKVADADREAGWGTPEGKTCARIASAIRALSGSKT